MNNIYGFIFNSGTLILSDIIEYIKSQHNVNIEELTIMNLKDDYPKFFEDIYKLGPIPNYDLKLKQNFVTKQNSLHLVYIVSISFDSLTEVFCERKNKNIYSEPEILKKNIRDKFKDDIEGYFHDILFHSADCSEEQLYLECLVENYKKNYPYYEIKIHTEIKDKELHFEKNTRKKT